MQRIIEYQREIQVSAHKLNKREISIRNKQFIEDILSWGATAYPRKSSVIIFVIFSLNFYQIQPE